MLFLHRRYNQGLLLWISGLFELGSAKHAGSRNSQVEWHEQVSYNSTTTFFYSVLSYDNCAYLSVHFNFTELKSQLSIFYFFLYFSIFFKLMFHSELSLVTALRHSHLWTHVSFWTLPSHFYPLYISSPPTRNGHLHSLERVQHSNIKGHYDDVTNPWVSVAIVWIK